MKRTMILTVMLLAITACSNMVFAADSARNVGDTGYLDGAQAIADVSTAYCAEVDANGDLGVAATMAMTLVRKESSQALGTGALSYTTDFSEKTKIKQILLHAGSDITQTVTFTVDSKTGATYDVVIAAEDLVAEQDYAYTGSELILEDGDEIKVTCTNSGTPAITVTVCVLGETIS